jgi:hypothetical protein
VSEPQGFQVEVTYLDSDGERQVCVMDGVPQRVADNLATSWGTPEWRRRTRGLLLPTAGGGEGIEVLWNSVLGLRIQPHVEAI